MLTVFRNHLKPVLLIVTIIICFAFGWFYVRYDTTTPGAPGSFGSIYGRGIGMHHVREADKHLQTAIELSLPGLEFLARGSTRSEYLPYFAHLQVLRTQAERLGIAASSQQIEDYIRNLPAFQTDGVWDADKFRRYAGTDHDDGLVITQRDQFGNFTGVTPPLKLSRRGMSVEEFKNVIADFILLENLIELKGSGIVASTLDTTRNHAISNQRVKLEVLDFPIADQRDNIGEPGEEELQALYRDQSDRFMTQEKMVVEYVMISPEKTIPEPAEDTAKEGEESQAETESGDAPEPEPVVTPEEANRIAGMADRIINAVGAGATLSEAAQDAGIETITTEPFAMNELPEEFVDRSPVQRALAQISPTLPVSTAVRDQDSWFILRLVETVAPEPIPFEDVRDELAEEWLDEQVRTAALDTARQAAETLAAALGEDADSITAAAAEADLGEPRTITLNRQTSHMESGGRELIRATELSPPGTLADPVMTAESVMLPFVISREVDANPDKDSIIENMKRFGRNRLQFEAFVDWFDQKFIEARFTQQVGQG